MSEEKTTQEIEAAAPTSTPPSTKPEVAPGKVGAIETRVTMSTPFDDVMQYFAYEHLPPKLQAVSKPFCELARHMVGVDIPAGTSVEFPLPRNPQRTIALNKLLEAKDAAVRAALAKAAPAPGPQQG